MITNVTRTIYTIAVIEFQMSRQTNMSPQLYFTLVLLKLFMVKQYLYNKDTVKYTYMT